MGNKSLRSAKEVKNDEFYTQLSTIEAEVMHYREHFKNKIVYLNCDDPRESNFFHYFSYNFERLGLKKLIASCYKSQDYNLFSLHDTNEKAVWLEYTGEKDGGRVPTAEAIGVHHFKGDGDFRSEESIKLLKEADIVVTNPPFSLFREFIAQMVKYDKKFLVIGNSNAITYKETFPLIKDNKMWPGVSRGAMTFELPDNTESTGYFIDETDGKKKQTLGNATWWTNLDFPRRNRDIILFRKYKGNEGDYPTYDNYDAINVDKVADIPMDFNGIIGVPISFIFTWNPEQFELLGATFVADFFTINKAYVNPVRVNANGETVSTTKINTTIVVPLSKPPVNEVYYKADNSGPLRIPYQRLFIRNKALNPEIYANGDGEEAE